MHRTILAATVALAAPAFGQIVNEIESNDTLATANSAGSIGGLGGGLVIDGAISAGDVDWFELTFEADVILLGVALFSVQDDEVADSQLQLVDSEGSIVAFDDDGGLGFQSSFEAQGLEAGTYFLGVSSFFDSDGTTLFDGIDDEFGEPTENEFTYKLVVGANLVPAPGSLALLGVAGFVSARRRR